jgi:hypothetical protein
LVLSFQVKVQENQLDTPYHLRKIVQLREKMKERKKKRDKKLKENQA